MNKKNVLLLINPNAGLGGAGDTPFKIIKELAVRGCEVTCYPILPKEKLGTEDILLNNPERFELIVVYGGDGTLNRIVSFMVENHLTTPIGYIPGGTTNDFSKSISTSNTIEQKCEDIVNGKVFAYDVGKFNNSYFNYIAAFGAFTWTSYTTSREAKQILGYTAYLLNGIGTLGDSLGYRRHVRIEHDGKKLEGTYIYGGISNAESVGGMKFPFIQNSLLDDGLFEVILISAPENPVDLGGTVLDIVSGKEDGIYVTVFRTNKLKMFFDEDTAWTLDGEEGGKYREVTFEVLPKAMSIMVTRK